MLVKLKVAIISVLTVLATMLGTSLVIKAQLTDLEREVSHTQASLDRLRSVANAVQSKVQR